MAPLISALWWVLIGVGQVLRDLVEIGGLQVQRAGAQPVPGPRDQIGDLVAELAGVRVDLPGDERGDAGQHEQADQQRQPGRDRARAGQAAEQPFQRVQHGGEEQREHEGERDEFDAEEDLRHEVQDDADDQQAPRPGGGDRGPPRSPASSLVADRRSLRRIGSPPARPPRAATATVSRPAMPSPDVVREIEQRLHVELPDDGAVDGVGGSGRRPATTAPTRGWTSWQSRAAASAAVPSSTVGVRRAAARRTRPTVAASDGCPSAASRALASCRAGERPAAGVAQVGGAGDPGRGVDRRGAAGQQRDRLGAGQDRHEHRRRGRGVGIGHDEQVRAAVDLGVGGVHPGRERRGDSVAAAVRPGMSIVLSPTSRSAADGRGVRARPADDHAPHPLGRVRRVVALHAGEPAGQLAESSAGRRGDGARLGRGRRVRPLDVGAERRQIEVGGGHRASMPRLPVRQRTPGRRAGRRDGGRVDRPDAGVIR